jgi:chromate reductase, NAD(P)H dehydrogenase (quinone)
MKKIIAFSGSNSNHSINQSLIRATAQLVLGTEVEVLDLRDYPAPVYGIDLEKSSGFPENMVAFHQKMLTADGFIVSSPEHNGSMPAVLKNTLDWLSRQEGKIFQDKPVVFLSTSEGERGGASVMKHILEIMPYRGAVIVGGFSIGNFSQKIQNDQFVDEITKESVLKLVDELVIKIAEK